MVQERNTELSKEEPPLSLAAQDRQTGHAKEHEVQVQGIPANLLGALWGTGLLLAALGALYELYAWDSESRVRWLLLLLLTALPLAAAVVHVRQTQRLRQPVFTLCFVVFFGMNALAIPFILYLPQLWLKLLGPFFALGYGLSLLWYGAFYNSLPYLLIACAFVLGSVVSIPFCYSLPPTLGGLILFIAGVAILGLAQRLNKLRETRLAIREQALRRQEVHRTKAE